MEIIALPLPSYVFGGRLDQGLKSAEYRWLANKAQMYIFTRKSTG